MQGRQKKFPNQFNQMSPINLISQKNVETIQVINLTSQKNAEATHKIRQGIGKPIHGDLSHGTLQVNINTVHGDLIHETMQMNDTLRKSKSHGNIEDRQDHRNDQDNSHQPKDRQESSANDQENPPKRKRTRSRRQSRSEANQDNPNDQPIVQDRLPQRNQRTPNSSKEDRRRIDLTDKTPVNFSFATNGTRPSYPGITPMNCPLKSEPQNVSWNAPLPLMENPIFELPSPNNSSNKQDVVKTLNSRRTSNQKARDPENNQQPSKEQTLEVALIEQQQQLANIRVGPIIKTGNESADHQSSKNKKRIAHQKKFDTPAAQPTQIYMRIKTEKPHNNEQVESRCLSPTESEEENNWQPDEIQYYRDIISSLNAAKDSQNRQFIIDGMRHSNKLSRFLQFKARYHRVSQ
ncbi:hypothetical protein M3Y97_00299100 [Aphelenchoides bicaudatus]|nr:hypothetical protein M3Y97_00299100 [Aphelenchoides bicaudatus]